MNEIQEAKIWTMVLLGLVSMILGALPLKLGAYFAKDDRGWKRVVTSVLLCFGGGVLFATSLIHMLPEVRENLEKAECLGIDLKGFPVAEILLSCGFFLIYLIEELVHFFLDESVHEHHDETMKTLSIHSQACEAGLTDIQIHQLNQQYNINNTTKRRRTVSLGPAVLTSTITTNYMTFPDNSKNESTGKKPKGTKKTSSISSKETEESCCNDEHEHSKSSLRDFFVVLALTFHAILEGIAVGLEEDLNDVWLLFAAVATHKYVMSFCVGLELYMAKTRLVIYCSYLFVYAIMSPIGIGIGYAIIGDNSDQTQSLDDPAFNVIVAVLQALAGGTILYVVAFEILERERSKSVSGLVQLAFVIIGFSVLMAVELLAGHHHHEGEEGCLKANVTTQFL